MLPLNNQQHVQTKNESHQRQQQTTLKKISWTQTHTEKITNTKEELLS